MYNNINDIEPKFAPYEYNENLNWYRKAWYEFMVQDKIVDNTNYE